MENSESKNQCHANTKSGKRCSRTFSGSGRYCRQHKELLEESLWSHKGGELDYLPVPPPVLTKKAAGFWNQYCQVLLDNDKLEGHYLSEIFEICWRIDFRDEIEAKIKQYGMINIYENGAQPNGLNKMMDQNDKRITDLKKMFGLTLDTASKLKGPAKSKPKTGNTDTGLRKVKGW